MTAQIEVGQEYQDKSGNLFVCVARENRAVGTNNMPMQVQMKVLASKNWPVGTCRWIREETALWVCERANRSARKSPT